MLPPPATWQLWEWGVGVELAHVPPTRNHLHLLRAHADHPTDHPADHPADHAPPAPTAPPTTNTTASTATAAALHGSRDGVGKHAAIPHDAGGTLRPPAHHTAPTAPTTPTARY